MIHLKNTTNLSKPTKQTWLKAAVIGSLWASLEIVVGSFLHNIRMPFAGTTLAFLSLSLLIGFHQKWQDKGLILRAGIIAALMRSLSPSAIIIGPMVGIFLEALLLESAIRIFGKNKIGYFIGAFVALSSALFQKIIAILIFYGFDIVVVLKNTYKFALHQFHFPNLNPNLLIGILFVFYLVIAFIATYLGSYAGKKALQNDNQTLDIQFSNETKLFVNHPQQKQITAYLFIHILAIIGGLFLLGFAPYYIAIPIVILYVILIKYKYKNTFRRISKPKFWIQLFVIILFAAIFFNGFNSKDLFNAKGIIAGLTMSFRAILLVAAFAAISYELRNPVVKAVLYKKGFSKLYISLGLAFGVLPSLLEQIANPKNIMLSPSKQIARLINFADNLLQSFQKELDKDQRIIIISGAQREGKTTFLKTVIDGLKDYPIQFDGIIAEGIDIDGKRTGFDIKLLKTNTVFSLASSTAHPNFIKYGRFYFDPAVFDTINGILKNAQADYVIIDEIGPLEIQGQGWSESIDELLTKNTPMIWVVRKSLLEKVMEHWQITKAQVFDISKYTPEDLISSLKKEIQ